MNSSDYRNKTLDSGSNVHETMMLLPTNINDDEPKTKNVNIQFDTSKNSSIDAIEAKKMMN